MVNKDNDPFLRHHDRSRSTALFAFEIFKSARIDSENCIAEESVWLTSTFLVGIFHQKLNYTDVGVSEIAQDISIRARYGKGAGEKENRPGQSLVSMNLDRENKKKIMRVQSPSNRPTNAAFLFLAEASPPLSCRFVNDNFVSFLLTAGPNGWLD